MRRIFSLLIGSITFVYFLGAGAGFKLDYAQIDHPEFHTPKASLSVNPDFGRMPLYFIENQGQMDKEVNYYVSGRDKSFYFTSGGITIALIDRRESVVGREDIFSKGDGPEDKAPQPGRWIVKLDFVGADKGIAPVGLESTEAVISYFRGMPSEWKKGLPTYTKVKYPNLWPGIDLVFSGGAGRMKYEYVVKPGADLSAIQMSYRGASDLSITEEGRLEVSTPAGSFVDGLPKAYQMIGGERKNVPMSYTLAESGKAGETVFPADVEAWQTEKRYGFEVGPYDPILPLVLDPVFLVYCGYVGGDNTDLGKGIALDNSGNVYVTGTTYSGQATFPVLVGPDLTYNGADAFVAKINSAGTALIYCGYIGGTNSDYGLDIDVDASGYAFIIGYTLSKQTESFPVVAGPDLTHNGNWDAFVAKVNTTGTGLVYCGYIGGSSAEIGYGIAVGGFSTVNAYVTGETWSNQASFPVKNGPDLTHNGLEDAFIAKVNSTGTGLSYCGYIGGSYRDYGVDIALNWERPFVGGFYELFPYVTGITRSLEDTFPVAVGPDLTHNGGFEDAFVTKVNSLGTGLIYCGYIGGNSNDFGKGIAVGGSNNAYVTGTTRSSSSTFPTKVGPDLGHNGDDDAFVAKVNSAGSGLDYCGYIGGTGEDEGHGIAVDSAGNAYVTGYTESSQTTFPVLWGPDLTYNGLSDAFVTCVNPTGASLRYSGYIGGTTGDYGYDISVSSSGNAYIIGETYSNQSSFPVAVGPDMTHNGGLDVFVAEVSHFFLTSPFGGETWTAGTTQNITWESSGLSGNVTLDLYREGDMLETIATVAVDDKSYPWSIPLGTVNDDEYRVRVTYNGKFVESAADFAITGGIIPSVTVTSPNGGEVWTKGTTQDITWTAVGLSGNVQVELYKDESFNSSIGWFPASAGSAPWEIGMERSTSDDYKIKISHADAHDYSNSDFTIKSEEWEQLTSANPSHMRRINLDGDGDQEAAVDFGAGGLWIYGSWTKLTTYSCEAMEPADLDGDTAEELIADFGSSGLWRNDGISWSSLTSSDAEGILAADTDGDGDDELGVDFGSSGFYFYDGTTWANLTVSDMERGVVYDLNKNGHEEFLLDFGSLGLWKCEDLAFTLMSTGNAENMVCGTVEAHYLNGLIVDFGASGIWLFSSNTWSQILGYNPQQVILCDVDGDRKDEVIADLGAAGLWRWDFGGGWVQLSSFDPEGILAAKTMDVNAESIIVDFGASGLWEWREGTWSLLTSSNAENILALDTDGDGVQDVLVDFGSAGLWLWKE